VKSPRIDLDALREALEALPAIRLAVLFGSAARGEVAGRSDVDLGVRLDPDSAVDRGEVIAAAAHATRRDIDLVDLDASPPLLRFQIARDGVLLVERAPHLWSRFKARAMTDWYDWAPTARKLHAVYVERLRQEVGHGRP
jgi:predicted nucleotidyltransferase